MRGARARRDELPIGTETGYALAGTYNTYADHNAQYPALWRPLEEHCLALGERFKFVRVESLAGYKAGALRVALADPPDPGACTSPRLGNARNRSRARCA